MSSVAATVLGTTGLGWIAQFVNPLAYSGLMLLSIATFLVVVPAAVPSFVRSMVDIEWTRLVPWLRFARVRRAVFGDYLQKDRLPALNRLLERYEPLDANGTAAHPAAIAESITAGTRGVVFIQAPGGRGKTALLTAVERSLIRRFVDPKSSSCLPIRVALKDEESGKCDVVACAHECIDNYLFGTPEARERDRDEMLLNGEIVLLFDGLSEAHVDPGDFAAFLRRYRDGVRVVATVRPTEEWRLEGIENPGSAGSAIAVGGHDLPFASVRVEPAAIVEAAAAVTFAGRYAPADRPVTPADVQACRAKDGGLYLPLLLRMVGEHGAGGARRPAAIVRRAFDAMVNDSVGHAIDFAKREYLGERARRRVAFPHDTEPEAAIVGLLAAAQVLKEGAAAGGRRYWVWFHDGFASCLIARAISGVEQPFLLATAAGAREGTVVGDAVEYWVELLEETYADSEQASAEAEISGALRDAFMSVPVAGVDLKDPEAQGAHQAFLAIAWEAGLREDRSVDGQIRRLRVAAQQSSLGRAAEPTTASEPVLPVLVAAPAA
jgi:hypothetical protein